MKQTVNAIYQNGILRPLNNLDISEGQEVQLTVESMPKASPEELLDLAAQVYQDLSTEQIDEIEQIALDRSNFFTE